MTVNSPENARGREVHLCFHGIGEPRRDLEIGEERYWVSRDQFLRQLDDVVDSPSIKLSFDDANSSDVEIALPALVERRLHATFYLLAGRIDHDGSLDRTAVADLVAAGMEIGNHGWHHTPWPQLSPADLTAEVLDARVALSEIAGGERVTRAALPLGRYNRSVLRALRSADYESVATSDRRVASTAAWLQPRFSVCATDNPQSVRASIDAASHIPIRWLLAGKSAAKGLR